MPHGYCKQPWGTFLFSLHFIEAHRDFKRSNLRRRGYRQQHQRREYGYENSAHRRIIVQIYKNNPILQHETQKKPRLACRGKKKTAEAVDYATDNSLSGDF